MKDRDVIDAFVAYLSKHGYPGLQVDRRPDEENRCSTDIDAIAGHFAIEHTSIDTIPNQRRDSDWFMRAAGGLEKELSNKLSFLLEIQLEYDAVTKAQDLTTIRRTLRKWITNDAPAMDDGCYVIDDIPGVPFRLHIEKASDRRPGVLFGRFTPDDGPLSGRIPQQLEKKANKLSKYHNAEQITVLLVESDDNALMNASKMLDFIRTAYPTGLPVGVNQIWYANTCIPKEIEFMDFTSYIEQ